jgi:hypothetical protein
MSNALAVASGFRSTLTSMPRLLRLGAPGRGIANHSSSSFGIPYQRF